MLADKSDIHIESNIEGDRVALGFDETSLVHLMGILTDLYSDSEYAIVREYSTNAWDAHVEAGNMRPIEVTLPTQLAPFLTIRDYGVGLDMDEIEQVYSKYGASTKRDSNEFNGQLGLGCKSALTYTSQFTVTAVKDGRRIQVIVTRDEDGGSMTRVSDEPTDEHNGVTIQIPAKSYNEIADKAAKFYRFWPSGTVLVNGEEPERIDGMRLNDNIIAVPEERDWIVMGNVPYPVNFGHSLREHGVVAFVPIGDVTMHPSRESLRDTPKTKATITRVSEEIVSSLETAVNDSINNAANAREAMQMANQWRAMLGRAIINMKLVYGKSPIPETYVAPEARKKKDEEGWVDPRFVVSAANSQIISRHSRDRTIKASWVTEGLLVYGYTLKFTPAHKKKMMKYAAENGIDVQHFILCHMKPKHLRWVEPRRIVHWDVIREIKLDEHQRIAAKNIGRIPGSYDLLVDGTMKSNVPGNDVPTNAPLFVRAINGRTFPKDWEQQADSILRKHHPGCTIAHLPANRMDKFMRLFPMAIDSKAALKALYEQFSAAITKEDRLAEHIQGDWYAKRRYRKLASDKEQVARIKDPEIKKAIAAFEADISHMSLLTPFKHLVDYIGVSRQASVNWDDPADDYPLFNEDSPEHNYTYINAAYPLVKKERIAARKAARAEKAAAKAAKKTRRKK